MGPIVISPRTESWEICVITQGEIGLGNLSGAASVSYQPPGLLYSAGDLLTHVSDSFRDRTEGVLLVDRIPGGGDDDPADVVTRWAAMEAEALDKGWAPTRSENAEIRYTGWVSFRNFEHGRTIHLGVLTMLDAKRDHAFDPDGNAATILQQVIDYGAITGVLWRLTGGVTCAVGIRADRAERAGVQLTIDLDGSDDGQPWWRWDSAPFQIHGAGRPIWSRDLCPAELQGFVATLDTRAEGLAAMASGRYGWGRPTRGKNAPFNPERAGFWQIPGRSLLGLDGPPLLDARHIDPQTGLTWVTTAAMVFYHERGIEPLVYDSYTSATSSEILKPYALKLRNALYSERLQHIRAGIRGTYKEGPSMWVKPGGSIFRPDWYHTHQDLGRMNLLRKVYKAKILFGCWPCRIYGDEVSYPVRDQQEFQVLASALGVKLRRAGEPEVVTSIGKLKLKSRELAEDWQAKQDKGKERISARR